MFEKLNSFTKDVSDLADKPALTPTELKAQFDAAPDEVRVYLNKLIDALKLTTVGDSGAKNIGATSISGITGTDVQTILENMAISYVKIVSGAWANVTTQNGWSNLAGYEGQCYKDALGFVHLRGQLIPGILTNGVVAFTLPEGYRPAKTFETVVKMYSNTNTLKVTSLIINTNGNCQIADNMDISFIRIDNVQFRTE